MKVTGLESSQHVRADPAWCCQQSGYAIAIAEGGDRPPNQTTIHIREVDYGAKLHSGNEKFMAGGGSTDKPEESSSPHLTDPTTPKDVYIVGDEGRCHEVDLAGASRVERLRNSPMLSSLWTRRTIRRESGCQDDTLTRKLTRREHQGAMSNRLKLQHEQRMRRRTLNGTLPGAGACHIPEAYETGSRGRNRERRSSEPNIRE